MEKYILIKYPDKEYESHIITASIYRTDTCLSLNMIIYNKHKDTYSIKNFNNELKFVEYIRNNFIDKK